MINTDRLHFIFIYCTISKKGSLLSLHNLLQFCQLIPEGWNHFGIIRYCHEKFLQNTTSSDFFITQYCCSYNSRRPVSLTSIGRPPERLLRHPPPAGDPRVQQPTASPGRSPSACCSAYSPSSPAHSPVRPGHGRCTESQRSKRYERGTMLFNFSSDLFHRDANKHSTAAKGYWASNTGHSWLFGMKTQCMSTKSSRAESVAEKKKTGG